MIFLWAFLLLAFATGSVQSQACSCPCSQEKVVEDTFEKESGRFTEMKFDSVLRLGLVSSILNPLLTSITNLLMVKVKIDTVDIKSQTDSLTVTVELSLYAYCKEIKSVVISVDVKVTLNVNTLDGCAQWSYLDDKLVVEISINGKSLTIGTIVLNALVKVIRPLLEDVVRTIVNVLIGSLNSLSSRLTASLYIGETEFHHEANNIKIAKGLISADICTFIEDEKTCWDKVGDMSLEENEYQLFNIPSKILRSVIAKIVNLISIKINLVKENLVCYILVNNYDSNFYLVVRIRGLKDCKFREDGVRLALDVEILIYSGKKILASATAVLTVTAETNHYHGYLSLYVNLDLQVDLDLTVTFTDDNCGCADTITELFKKLFNLHLNVLLGELNCNFKRLLLLPVISGITGKNGQCVSKKDYCRCALSK